MKKAFIFLLSVLMLFLLSAPAFAAETDISVTIPASHTVTVNCSTGGKVTVDGKDCTGANNAFSVARHSSFTLTATAEQGYVLESITSNSTNGMTLSSDAATLPSVCGDVRIVVSFRSTMPAPDPVPDPAPDPIPVPTIAPAPVRTYAPVPKQTFDPAPKQTFDQTPAIESEPKNATVPVIGDAESMKAGAVIIGDTAQITVDETELDALLTSDTGAKTVTIDVSNVDADVNTVVIPVSTIQAVAEKAASEDNAMTGMDVVMPHTTATFDAAALTAIAEQAQDDNVTFHAERISPEKLNTVQQTVLEGAPENVVVVEVTLRSGGAVISDFRGGSAEISMPYTPEPNEDTETISVWFVAQDGTMTEIPCRYEAGFVRFTVQHFSNYLIRPGTIAAQASAIEEPAVAPASSADDSKDDEDDHCFLCGWFGHDIAPWCYLILLLVISALAFGVYQAFIGLRKKQ